MNKLTFKIVKILSSQVKYFTRQEIEEKLQRVSKRTVLNEIKKLKISKRLEVVGQSSSTAYKISNEYFEDFENVLYIYQNQVLIGYLGYDFDKYYFAYDTNYVLEKNHTAKFQMPYGFDIYAQKTCFVDFEECLPEGIDRKILKDKVGNATEFFLLAKNNYSKNDLIFSKNLLNFSKKIKPKSFLAQKEKILGKNRFPNVCKSFPKPTR